MTDFFAQSLQAFQERMRTPWIGSILIAFLLWNWQPLLFLVASDTALRHAIYLFREPHGLVQPLCRSRHCGFLVCRSKAMDFPSHGLARGAGDTSE